MSKSQSESQSQSGPHRERPTNSTSCRRAPGSNERNNNTDNTSRQGGGLRAAPLPHPLLATRLALTIAETAAAYSGVELDSLEADPVSDTDRCPACGAEAPSEQADELFPPACPACGHPMEAAK